MAANGRTLADREGDLGLDEIFNLLDSVNLDGWY
jgi:hypothetical protein